MYSMFIDVFIYFFIIKVCNQQHLANGLILNLNIYNLNFLIYFILLILIVTYLVVLVLFYLLYIIVSGELMKIIILYIFKVNFYRHLQYRYVCIHISRLKLNLLNNPNLLIDKFHNLTLEFYCLCWDLLWKLRLDYYFAYLLWLYYKLYRHKLYDIINFYKLNIAI